jgi:hypothetical protein
VSCIRLQSGNREQLPALASNTILHCSPCSVAQIHLSPPTYKPVRSLPAGQIQRIDISVDHPFQVLGAALRDGKARLGDVWVVALRLSVYAPDFPDLLGNELHSFHITLADCVDDKGKDDITRTSEFQVRLVL